MKFVELAKHVHQLRHDRTGRKIGAGMSFSEAWTAALDCPDNGIERILYFRAPLPEPFHGFFARMRSRDDSDDTALIVVHPDLENSWAEFVSLKELMHCWYPSETFVGSPSEAKSLVEALVGTDNPYTPAVASDQNAIFAAAEVMLPHEMVEWHLKNGHDHQQIAFSHNLDADVVKLICSLDFLHARKNGSLSD